MRANLGLFLNLCDFFLALGADGGGGVVDDGDDGGGVVGGGGDEAELVVEVVGETDKGCGVEGELSVDVDGEAVEDCDAEAELVIGVDGETDEVVLDLELLLGQSGEESGEDKGKTELWCELDVGSMV